MQSAHLVVHQRNQRRDNDGDTVTSVLPCNGRYLVAQRLAATRGHQHQRIATVHHMVNDGRLRAAKVRIAKDLTQNVQWGRLMCQLRQFEWIYLLLKQELLAHISIDLKADLIGKNGCF